jgi:molecular chaperone GrpE
LKIATNNDNKLEIRQTTDMNTEPEEKSTETGAAGSDQAENFASDCDSQLQSDPQNELDELFAEGTRENGGAEVSIQSLQVQLADAEKRVLMAHADLDNFRRRTRRDMQDQLRYATLGLMSELLESVDNLQRAIESYEQDPNGEGLVEGVKMVAKQIATTLENNGCKKIEAVGQPFDPNLHQALQMQPSNEFEPNTVMMDLRPGFQLYDRVVRPAQVFVSTGPAESSEK